MSHDKEAERDLAFFGLMFLWCAILVGLFYWVATSPTGGGLFPPPYTIEWGSWHRGGINDTELIQSRISNSLKPKGLQCLVGYRRESVDELWQVSVWGTPAEMGTYNVSPDNIVQQSCLAYANQK